jgi:hypothetical protein
MPRRLRPLLAAFLLAWAPGPPARALEARAETEPAAPPPSEYQVKAAFLYHFAQLVEWPAGAPDGRPFEIGLLGDDVFGPHLEAALSGKRVHERPIRVQRYTSLPEPSRRPPLLFIAAADAREAERVLRALGPAPVLTVGEVPGFAARGGMIGFRLTAEGRVAFDINLRQAERSGLRMSSQLLKLANIVDGP